ncbi:MAG: LysM peptidoglycan-binding domain-containing protein, partial [Actinobacteria bacterium]|nr:LysM peptidoglycan-binding domain-containing protein [Actinomycetota bacterium]
MAHRAAHRHVRGGDRGGQRPGPRRADPRGADADDPEPGGGPLPGCHLRPRTVVRGDTLSHIAARHGTTVATLMSTNGLRSTL